MSFILVLLCEKVLTRMRYTALFITILLIIFDQNFYVLNLQGCKKFTSYNIMPTTKELFTSDNPVFQTLEFC